MEIVQLPKEFREEFLEALRSGRYKQGKSSLVAEDEHRTAVYCCLGVACHILGISQDLLLRREYPQEVECDIEIPEALMDSRGYAGDLATMNDNGDSFEDIANYIEFSSVGV